MRSRHYAGAAGLAIIAALTLAGCGSDSDGDTASDTAPTTATTKCTYTDDGRGASKEVDPPSAEATESGQVAVTIATSAGDIKAELDADAAPCTVHSFVSLAKQGYFDSTSCHRLTTSGIAVLQCGDPTGSGSGGPGYSFNDELSGSETYPAGTLAMANAGPNTNGSQFFVVYGDTQLDPAYTVFGTIDDASIKVVQKVADAGTDNAFGDGDGHPNTPVDITKVTVG
ncbi:peptidylprolyl isomerase [Nocardioides sp. Root1257]|uniref:peptidylprolyl isomerase n=1 Tax=unclassified Nocardioides TaxID=2615069 RepID=UPI0006FB0BFF|nr:MULTISPECIES: peptidylprolyl isomerase [unclassified Nocardioides]KQW52956.1 peptidylprolyl isomerase [Nocardioides sp. Root1257]KRC55644.1 peptidylprolyl isomerase [Nocardioides sp. Root224]